MTKGSKSKTVVQVLTEAHDLLLNTWSHGEGEGCDENCVMQCIVLANGQKQEDWDKPDGPALDAALILADLIVGTEEADEDEGPDWRGSYWGGNWAWTGRRPTIHDVTEFNDTLETRLQDMSDLMLDAIDIATVEAV